MKKKTIKEIGEIVFSEGLEYSVTNYLSAENIQDEELSKLWKAADLAMIAVNEYLKKELGGDYGCGQFVCRFSYFEL